MSATPAATGTAPAKNQRKLIGRVTSNKMQKTSSCAWSAGCATR